MNMHGCSAGMRPIFDRKSAHPHGLAGSLVRSPAVLMDMFQLETAAAKVDELDQCVGRVQSKAPVTEQVSSDTYLYDVRRHLPLRDCRSYEDLRFCAPPRRSAA